MSDVCNSMHTSILWDVYQIEGMIICEYRMYWILVQNIDDVTTHVFNDVRKCIDP